LRIEEELRSNRLSNKIPGDPAPAPKTPKRQRPYGGETASPKKE
jgi:hypothetical protein